MNRRYEIAIAAFFAGVGFAGMPLEPLRMLLAAALCTAAVLFARRFMAASALAATLAAGYAQHGQLRIVLLAAAALVGLSTLLVASRPRAAVIFAVISAVVSSAFLLRGSP
ncbi:MAG: hypothetical protein M3R51_03995 [Candidatus Eremiobacteraeota bacterium]|nr:hypothetical protein [Candidatus Eremiobacteraeota bacterium]